MLKTSISSAMIVCLIAMGIGLTSLNASAHNPNTATFILSKATDGNYLVQLDGALTGVEAQINQIYSSTAYKTAEQFESLANEHFVKSLTLSINDQPINLANPSVQLGHGTQFTAELQGVPKTIESIELTNTFFKDLHGNKMSVVFLSDQLPSTTYALDNTNQHHLSLTLTDGQWQQGIGKETSPSSHSNHANTNSHVDTFNSADAALDNKVDQVSAATTEIKASKPLSSSTYILGISAFIAAFTGMLLFVRK